MNCQTPQPRSGGVSLKDGLIKTYNGGVDNRLEIIGALEAAKVLMWEDEL